MKFTTKGFTLIELVVVIVILGILAATALPKFVDLGKDARIGSLNALKGTLEAAARLAQGKCVMSPTTCGGEWANGAGTRYTLTYNGTSYYFSYNWPVAWAGNQGIAGWVDYTGFTLQPYINGSGNAVFTKDGAPNPANCKVTYNISGNSSDATTFPVVSIVDTEC